MKIFQWVVPFSLGGLVLLTGCGGTEAVQSPTESELGTAQQGACLEPSQSSISLKCGTNELLLWPNTPECYDPTYDYRYYCTSPGGGCSKWSCTNNSGKGAWRTGPASCDTFLDQVCSD